MKELPPLIISGSIAIDRLMTFDGRYADLIQPDKLDSLAVFPLITSITDALGGVGGNIAYSAALLGDQPVLLASAGSDAEAYMQKLAKDGVEITHVHRSDQLTASFTAITDTHQSQVGGFYPGAMADSASLTLDEWKDLQPIILIGAHDPAAMRMQVQQCVDYGLKLIYDPGQQVANLPAEDLAAGIKAAHVLIVNEYETGLLAKKTGLSEDELAATVPVLITTLGRHGSRISGKEVETPIDISIAMPEEQKDPTGAGDAYRAGLLHGLRHGWPLKECAQLGAVMGSFALEQIGTQNHRPGQAQISARYQQTFDEPLPNYEQL